MAKKKSKKISTNDAIKTIANEINLMKADMHNIGKDLIETRNNLKDVALVFDQFIDFSGKSEEFLAHIEKLIAEKEESDKDGDVKDDNSRNAVTNEENN